MWKKISFKTIFTHPRITVFEDVVKLQDGKRINYLKYDENFNGAITVIAIRDDGKILIEKEYSYPPNQELFQFPGGGINIDEKPEIAVNRELMEEVKLKANNLKLLGWYYLNNRRSDKKLYVFLATRLKEEYLKEDETEKIDIVWKSEKEINEMIKNGEIVHPHFLAAWAIYMSQK